MAIATPDATTRMSRSTAKITLSVLMPTLVGGGAPQKDVTKSVNYMLSVRHYVNGVKKHLFQKLTSRIIFRKDIVPKKLNVSLAKHILRIKPNWMTTHVLATLKNGTQQAF